jgi:hypothetical protein
MIYSDSDKTDNSDAKYSVDTLKRALEEVKYQAECHIRNHEIIVADLHDTIKVNDRLERVVSIVELFLERWDESETAWKFVPMLALYETKKLREELKKELSK